MEVMKFYGCNWRYGDWFLCYYGQREVEALILDALNIFGGRIGNRAFYFDVLD